MTQQLADDVCLFCDTFSVIFHKYGTCIYTRKTCPTVIYCMLMYKYHKTISNHPHHIHSCPPKRATELSAPGDKDAKKVSNFHVGVCQIVTNCKMAQVSWQMRNTIITSLFIPCRQCICCTQWCYRIRDEPSIFFRSLNILQHLVYRLIIDI